MTAVTQEQTRRVAQLMYPQLWETSPVDAIVKALEFVYETASNVPKELGLDGNGSKNLLSIVSTLKDLVSRRTLHVKVIAKALSVSPYTVRTWLEGKYTPNDQNLQKLSDFLKQFRETPAIMSPAD